MELWHRESGITREKAIERAAEGGGSEWDRLTSFDGCKRHPAQPR